MMKPPAPQSLVDLVVPASPHHPWQGYTGAEDAVAVIEQYLAGKGRSWALLPARSYEEDEDAPQRALARQVLRAQNEIIGRVVEESAKESVDPAMTINRLVARAGSSRKNLSAIFSQLVRVDMYSGRHDGPQIDTVLDVRDFGFGLDCWSCLDIFDEASLKHPCVLKSQFLSRPSYTYAPYTLVVSRRAGEPVSVAVIRRTSTRDRFYYLVEPDGGLPQLRIPEEQFSTGTLVRHIGYEAPFYNAFKENSVQGALDRNLPGMRFPVATYYHDLGGELPDTQERLAMGAIQRLAWLSAEMKVGHSDAIKTLAEVPCAIDCYEFFAKAATRDALRPHCRPRQPVLFIKEGQTVATTAAPAQLTLPTVITIDVSRFTAEKIKRLRADQDWRDDLVCAALNLEREHTTKEVTSDQLIDLRPAMVEAPTHVIPEAAPVKAPAAPAGDEMPLPLRMVSAAVRRLVGR